MSTLVQIGNPSASAKSDSVRPNSPRDKALLAVAGVGWAMLALALVDPSFFGSATWAAPAMFGLVAVGSVGYFLSVYAGTTPGIKNHGVFHTGLFD